MDGYLLQLVAIRAHNDELRTRFRGGTVSVSDEVKELGDIVVAHALRHDGGSDRVRRRGTQERTLLFLRAPVPMVDLLWRLAQPGEREDHEARIVSLAVDATTSRDNS